MTEGQGPEFTDAAVKWRAFDQTLVEARGKFVDLPEGALESAVDEAVVAARGANAATTG